MVFTNTSYILKPSAFIYRFVLSMYDLLVDTKESDTKELSAELMHEIYIFFIVLTVISRKSC